MALFTNNCPRCKMKHMTFDVYSKNVITPYSYELFCVCKSCRTSTVFVVRARNGSWADVFSAKSLSEFQNDIASELECSGFISQRDHAGIKPPAHLSKEIEDAFVEGANCFAIGCYNAAATMFRLCLDLVTSPLLPAAEDGEPQPNSKQRRDLGLRLQWLFEHKKLSDGQKELASCIKEEGNNGAHRGTLTKADCEDLIDFTVTLLERLETEPAKLKLAKERREERRKVPT
jgi:hypothetical protein